MAFKTGGGDELNSEINVTPFVDVMLVLLVIFMITTPLMTNAVALDLPPVTAEAPNDPSSPLVLKIKPDRTLELGTTVILWTELEAKIKNNDKVQEAKKLYIAGDQHLPYGVVATAMAMVKRAGVEHVMLLTSPGEEMKPADLDQPQAPHP